MWKGEGDRSCVCSKGAILDLLPWSRRRWVPGGIPPFPGVQGRNRAALHSMLPFTPCGLSGTVESNPWKQCIIPDLLFYFFFLLSPDYSLFPCSFSSTNYMVLVRTVLIQGKVVDRELETLSCESSWAEDDAGSRQRQAGVIALTCLYSFSEPPPVRGWILLERSHETRTRSQMLVQSGAMRMGI